MEPGGTTVPSGEGMPWPQHYGAGPDEAGEGNPCNGRQRGPLFPVS